MPTVPPFIETEPKAWDALYIKNALAPGIVKDIRVTRTTKIDVKNAKGANGANITVEGYEPAKVEIVLTLWTERHFKLATYLIAAAFPNPAKARKLPFAFSHPILAMHGLRDLLIESTDGPGHPGPGGVAELTLHCVEFFPPAKANATSTIKATDPIPPFNNSLIQPPAGALPAPPPKPSAGKPTP